MALIRVLVVDDHKDWRKLIFSLLQEDPAFEIVGEALDGVRAVQMADEMQPMVILLDIGLPRLNGIQAGAWIQKLAPDAKIIFVSQEFDPEIIDAAMRINAAGFVLKSDIAGALIPAVHAAIRDEKFMSNELVRSLFRDKFKK
jgi:DNA-binding NarL/FixJ family response regulator